MTFLEFLDRRHERLVARKPRRSILPTEFSGWLACGLFFQSNALFLLMWHSRELIDNQGFMTLASAVIVTGWIGGAVAFAYSAGKRDGDKNATADKAIDLAHALAPPPPPPEPTPDAAPSGTAEDPLHVVDQTDDPTSPR